MYNYKKAYGMMPQHPFGNLMKDVNKMFYDDNWSNTTAPVNIKETDTAYEIQVVAPGFNKDGFKLKVEENNLSIAYEHKTEDKETTDKMLRNEYQFRSFKRSFTLSDKVNADNIRAKYTDGVLLVTVPKKEATEKASKDITVA